MDQDKLTYINSPSQLREILGPVSERAKTKVRQKLTEIDRKWIAASPFCLVSTSDKQGNCDVSPKGDPAGFTLVLDDHTLAIPERPGNRRADGFHNILENGHIGILYIIPGRGDTLRINGQAKIISEAPCFDQMITKGHRPALALLVSIEEIFFHCSKAFLRSDFWEASSWNPNIVPSRACIANQLENSGASIQELETYYGDQYRKSMY